MIAKITALAYYDFDKVKNDICPGNLVKISRDRRWDKGQKWLEKFNNKYPDLHLTLDDGRAYKAVCKDYHIGYIPLVTTLMGFLDNATSDYNRDSLTEQIKATSAVRIWMNSQENYMLKHMWELRVHGLMYDHFGVHKPEDNGKVAAVAVDFEDVPKD